MNKSLIECAMKHAPKLPKNTQKAVLWLVRLYPGLVLQREAILQSSPAIPDIPTKVLLVSDPTYKKVAQLEHISRQLDAIQTAKASLPDEYKQGVWNYCLFKSPFPPYADYKTWYAYVRDFLYVIAYELGYPVK